MGEIDIAQEWRRLQGLYAAMSEEELEAIADESYELTDIAKQALKAEISRRGLQVIVRLAPAPEKTQEKEEPHGDLDPADLELSHALLRVWNPEEAGRVKALLNDANIACYFGPNLDEGVDRLQYPKDKGVEVKVPYAFIEPAQYALRDFLADETEAIPDFSSRCPKCHSTEIVFLGLDSDTTEEHEETEDTDETEQTAAEQTGPDPKFNWSCDACGYQWKDDGVESES